MEINLLGVVAAFSAFLGIWLGHVSVRAIERAVRVLWLPILIALSLGFALEAWSLVTDNRYLSTITGILGITIFWDALEFVRQEKRVKKGHAPANPSNLRHVQILLDFPSSTSMDLLNRDPLGHPVSTDEAIKIVKDRRTL